MQTQLDTLINLSLLQQAGADVKEDLKNWAKAQEAELAEETGELTCQMIWWSRPWLTPYSATVMTRVITFFCRESLYTFICVAGGVDSNFYIHLNVWIGIRLCYN